VGSEEDKMVRKDLPYREQQLAQGAWFNVVVVVVVAVMVDGGEEEKQKSRLQRAARKK